MNIKTYNPSCPKTISITIFPIKSLLFFRIHLTKFFIPKVKENSYLILSKDFRDSLKVFCQDTKSLEKDLENQEIQL
jgi:hypothetical protein